MDKPKNVDKHAKWKSDAWHKGKLVKSADGGKQIPIGKYTIWNDQGIMTNDGDFDESGNVLWFKSYFPDGSIGRIIKYDKALNVTKVRWESHHEYCEKLLTPFNEDEKGYAEKVLVGKMSQSGFQEIYHASRDGVSFYNESGEFVRKFENDNYEALKAKYTQKDKNENWESALERLDNYLLAYKAQRIKDGDGEIEDDYFSISFENSVNKKEIENAENRLGVTFPESYKSFVLRKGLLKFGEIESSRQSMLHPIAMQSANDMLDPEEEGYFNDYYNLPIEKIKKIICFFEDQVDYQYDGYIAFDCSEDSIDEKNIIMHIGCKNIFEWEEEIGKEVFKGQNSMDRFISDYVNVLIEQREP